MKLLILLCLCVTVAQCALAPIQMAKTRGIPDSFIIKVKDASLVDQVADEIQNQFVKMRFPTPIMTKIHLVMPAVTLRIPPHLIDDIRSLDGVEYIEQDILGWPAAYVTQNHPTWGLDRIDQRNGLNSAYTYNDITVGEGVNIYLLDTGVQIDHSEFGGRAHILFGTADVQGHGTHCAGTAAGRAYGIARKANVYSARVCEPAGCATSDFIAGSDAIVKHANGQSGVVSISLVFPAWTGIDTAVQGLLDHGLTVSVCAGNDNADACYYSPQRVVDTITVGATDIDDKRAYFSNFGSCVDIFAPGVDIISAGFSTTSNHFTAVMSGTSMACPHVSGVAALYVGVNKSASPKTIKSLVVGDSTPNVVRDAKGDNKFLFSGGV